MSVNRFRRFALVIGVASAVGALGVPGAALADTSTGSSVDSGSADDLLKAVPPELLEQLGLGGLGGGSPKVQQCNQSTKSGGQGVTETKHIIGRTGPTSFTLNYDTRIQPDKIDVYYQGRLIRSTGYVGDRINKGKGSVVVNVPPGIANYVTVKVTGPESGTVWDYTVNCPR
ncbi:MULTISPECIES: hypothetical protein [Gordonia]|uniref:hypothetical protein n=1 Tax=Gordonia TaxID=2053 RepID=UPI0007EA769A|nr:MULTISPECIES: hypothetical protein [Gordonia]OBA33471.1 hypothetical protein A5766_11735 [Gordonia sp. 852002-51296_SCH5728562-b]